MFKLTTYPLDKSNDLHYMLLTEPQVKVHISRADSSEYPAKSAITNWFNGLTVLDDPPMFVGHDFNGRKVTVEVL